MKAGRDGIYFFSEFSPGALAAYSSRDFDASKDLPRFLEVLKIDPVRFCTVRQVHGNRVLLASQPFIDGEADGLVTGKRNLPLLIRTADCAPVLFFDAEAPAVGICHAGWRGAKRGIVRRVVEMFQSEFGSDPASLQVALAPAIRESCYEVGKEFEDYFPGGVRRRGEKCYFDLVGTVKGQLTDLGVKETLIADSNLCTACATDRFFSARREGIKTGRFLSLIMLK